MSKALASAALIVGSVALIATGIGAGAGALGLSAAGAALAEGVATVATVASIGLEIGATLLAPKPTTGGSQTTFKADPFAGIPYVMGRTLVGGNIIYRRTYNTPGYSLPDLQSFGVILSGAGPIDGIESFQSDKPTAVYDANNNLIATTDTRVSFDSSGNALGFFNSWMFMTTQLGATPESGVLRKTYGGTLPPDWTTSSKLSGYAAAMWTLRYDQKGKVYTNGVPVPGWVIRGVKVYDPRLDSTYPGGSGGCRAGVESTYVYSENAYLHGLTWCLGRYQNGTRILGIGAPVAGIDVPAFVEGANVADANGWKVGGVIYSTDNKWNVLKSILQAGGGEPMHLGAKISCMINTPRVVLDTVTFDDIAGEVQVTATQARRDRINAIVGTYRSEAHQWEVIQASPIQVSSYIAVDGGLRMPAKDYPLVQNLNQMAQLARYDIENAREFGPVVLPLKPRWMGYKPGDCIAVTLPESGLAAQPCIIRNRDLGASNGIVTLTCRSETAAKHPFALGQTAIAPPTPTVTGPPLIPVPADGAWTIGAVGLTTGNSTTPALVITGAATGVSIDGIVFEYRLYSVGQADGAGWIATGGPDLPTSTRKEITALLPGTRYEAAVSYQLGATTGARRIIGPATTSGVAVDYAGVGGVGRPEDNATLNRASDEMNRNSSFEVYSGGVFPGWSIGAAAAGYGGFYQDTNQGGRGVYSVHLTGPTVVSSEAMPVIPGETIFFELHLCMGLGRDGTNPGTAAQVFASANFNATGSATAATLQQPLLNEARFGGSAATDTTYSFVVPAGMNTLFLAFVLDATAGSQATCWVGNFSASRRQPGADITAPVLTAKGIADGADKTSANIAAGFHGQGLLSTQDTVDYASQVTGKPTSSSRLTVTMGNPVQKYMQPGDVVVCDAGVGTTGASTGAGQIYSTILANGTEFARSGGSFFGPSEPTTEVIIGASFTNTTGIAQLFTFTSSYAHTGGSPAIDPAHSFLTA